MATTVDEIIRLSKATTAAGLTLSGIRRRLIHELRAIIKPKLRNSGYLAGGIDDADKYYQIVLFKSKNPENSYRTRKLAKPFTLREGFIGFAEDGIITDAVAGGIATAGYHEIAIEDLMAVLRLVLRLKPEDYY